MNNSLVILKTNLEEMVMCGTFESRIAASRLLLDVLGRIERRPPTIIGKELSEAEAGRAAIRAKGEEEK